MKNPTRKTYTLKLSATQIYNLRGLLDANKKVDDAGKVKFWPLADGGKSLDSVLNKVEKLEYKAGEDYKKDYRKKMLGK